MAKDRRRKKQSRTVLASPARRAAPEASSLAELGVDLEIAAFEADARAEQAKPVRSGAVDFARRVRREIPLPSEARVVGEPVVVTDFREPGRRSGVRAMCQRGGRSYEIGLEDLDFGAGKPGARLVADYRAWLGIDAAEGDAGTSAGDVASGQPVDLIVLARKSSALRCRLAGTSRELTLRTAVRDEVPGATITVRPTRQWTYGRREYLAGEVSAIRVDAGALRLVPLLLREEGEWNPAEEYWGDEGEPIDVWAQRIIADGPRPMYEFEQVIPGAEPEDDTDAIIEAAELRAAGEVGAAIDMVEALLTEDLRCLDAHAHLGNFVFDGFPQQALRHYEVGAAIGELSLPRGFDGVLPWGLVDNRPYLRCLHGLGLCLWRLGRTPDAVRVFNRMLRLNPGDNQGVRFELAAIEAGQSWQAIGGDGY